jgi:hypothetical protein
MEAGRPRLDHGNSKRAREIYGLLAGSVLTITQIAVELGMTRNAVARALWRMKNTMDVPIVEVGEELPEVQGHGGNHGEVYYTILFPEGRVCTVEGCYTILSRRNPAERCSVHGGWTL